MPVSRRAFLSAAAVSTAFGGFALKAQGQAVEESYRNEVFGYGPLKPDPKGLFDLPDGFSYRVVSRFGETMDDGLIVPDKADGMACFPLDADRVVLVRNHELGWRNADSGPLGPGRKLLDKLDRSLAYDLDDDGYPLPGGCTRMVYDLKRGALESQHLALTGTVVNCAGGGTPWGAWLSCEENTVKAGLAGARDHGWVYEVPAHGKGLVKAEPLTDLGRFQHEAIAVDPTTGVIYLTEDSFDHKGLFYRFLPNDRAAPAKGGKLQALGLKSAPEGGDVRNFDGKVTWKPGDWAEVVWIDLEGVDNPDDDLRFRGQKAGAAFTGRGEGVFWDKGGVYFTATSSGPAQHGQVLRYAPSPKEGQPGEADAPGRLQLFAEPTDGRVMDYADNLAIAPWGHILACEDRYSDTLKNHLKGLTPEGRIYTIGRNVHADNAELAGVCISSDGSTVFVNIYQPGMTLAITGPWGAFRA